MPLDLFYLYNQISCNVVNSLDNFHKKKAARDGLQAYCKDCINAKKRKWREKKRAKKGEAASDKF